MCWLVRRIWHRCSGVCRRKVKPSCWRMNRILPMSALPADVSICSSPVTLTAGKSFSPSLGHTCPLSAKNIPAGSIKSIRWCNTPRAASVLRSFACVTVARRRLPYSPCEVRWINRHANSGSFPTLPAHQRRPSFSLVKEYLPKSDAVDRLFGFAIGQRIAFEPGVAAAGAEEHFSPIQIIGVICQ